MQLWHMRRELAPDPDREELGCRVIEAFDLVEQVVIEAGHDGVDGTLQVCEIDEPADRGIDGSPHHHLAAEGVAVHAPALVSLRHMG